MAASDVPPANFGASSSDEADAGPLFTGFRGKYGLLKTNIVTSYAMVGAILGGPTSKDGILFLAYSEPIADAWVAWAKADPRYMRIVQLLWGGPFMTLAIAHGPLIAGLAANHNVNLMKFLSPVNLGTLRNFQARPQPAASQEQYVQNVAERANEEYAMPYQPVGPNAPTEDPGPPPTPLADAPLRTIPDEGIPADIETQLRQAAMQNHIPYAELRDAYILQAAQVRMAQNGNVAQPRTLGEPVQREY